MKTSDAEEFLAELLALGFGRMKPSHYEPYLFRKLMQVGIFDDGNKGYSEVIAMSKLQVDIKQLRKLKSTADRLFPPAGSVEPMAELRKIIKAEQFDFYAGDIRLQITDARIRDAIEFALMNQGVILDYSFSRNILKLSLPTFVKFISSNGKGNLPNEFLKQLENCKGDTIQATVKETITKTTYKQKDVWDKIESISRSIKNITGAGKDISQIILGLSIFQ